MEALYPEVRAGGFSRLDGTVAFYTRVNALLEPSMTVVDFGAGRGSTVTEDPVEYRKRLRILRGKVREVIGVDVDPVVLRNPTVDRARVITPGAPLPLADDSVDLILSDHTFEHLEEPEPVASEFFRILRSGGWICARTTNRWGYVGIGARLVPNALHKRVLAVLQPDRPRDDVYPTRYRLNSRSALRRHFPEDAWEHSVYALSIEPLYFSNWRIAWRAMAVIAEFTPNRFATTILAFLRKK